MNTDLPSLAVSVRAASSRRRPAARYAALALALVYTALQLPGLLTLFTWRMS